MTSERPRRSARVPASYREKHIENASPAQPSTSKKRKQPPTHDSSQTSLDSDFLLTNPKSPLVDLELSTLINERTWSALSQDSRALLSTMLPQTIFPFFRPTLGSNHPARRQSTEEYESDTSNMDVDATALASEPDPFFFTDPFFEAGAKTFQDHLYSGWSTPAHQAFIREFTEKLKNGEIYTPWKDDVWREEHPIIERNTCLTDGLAGEASTITLKDLAKHSIIRVGDLLAYRRCFSQLNHIVEKDALITSIQPSSHSITVLVSPSTQTHLPAAHLEHPTMVETSEENESPTTLLSVTIVNPSQLENALLDIDASVEKSKRTNANAWKSIGVWRWRDREVLDPSAYAEGSDEVARGYREYRGTLFYVRGCFYEEF